jgi:hypothetical protein
MQVELIVLGVVLLMLPAALATNPTASEATNPVRLLSAQMTFHACILQRQYQLTDMTGGPS